MRPPKHVKKQLEGSLLKSAQQVHEYQKWNAILEQEGMRLLDDNYRGSVGHTSNKVTNEGPGSARLEFYDVFRDYCRYSQYQLPVMDKMPVDARKHFAQMLIHYVNGQSRPNAYRAVAALSTNILSQVYFHKQFERAVEHFKQVFGRFSAYTFYRKYEHGEPLSFQAWLSRESLSSQ